MKTINTNKIPVYRDAGFCLETIEKTLKAFQDENNNVYEPETLFIRDTETLPFWL